MAKKKKLPKAMMGKIVGPVIRGVVSTGKVATKATVRSAKASYNAVGNAPTIKGPVSLVKAGAKGIKAGAKGFTRGVKSEIKTEKLKAAERAVADKAKAVKDKAAKTPPISEEKRLMDELNAMKDKKPIADKKPVKKPMSKRKKIAIVGGTGAAVAAIKYATREKRTLKD